MVAMGIFPAIYSTLSPQALIKGVLVEYEIGEVRSDVYFGIAV